MKMKERVLLIPVYFSKIEELTKMWLTFSVEKQTTNQNWLVIQTYDKHMCPFITKLNIDNRMYTAREKLKFTFSFEHTSYFVLLPKVVEIALKMCQKLVKADQHFPYPPYM